MQLIKWDKIRHQIEEAKDIKELTNLKDKLRAYQILAEQSRQSQEVQAKIAIYKARADRKCGEWLKDNIKQGNIKGSNQRENVRSRDVTLQSVGVTKNESSRLQKIADIPEDKFEGILLEAEVETKKITNNMLVNIAKEADRDNIKKEVLTPAKGKYQCIVIDPPWPYGTKYNSGTRRVASPYPEQSIEELLEFKIPADKNCVLWLWTTHRFLKDSFDLMEKWGFDYKATMVWDKQRMGMGAWLRMQCEFCLMGVRGKPVWNLTNERDIISVARREHSRKPDEFYKLINTLVPTKHKIDIFSREKRDGWQQYGNETEKF